MSFDNPRLLWFLFLLIPFCLVMLFRYRKHGQGSGFFVSSGISASVFAASVAEREKRLREFRFRMIGGDFFFLVFLLSLVFALAGPRWGVRIVTDYRRGVDVILALDISRSMQVRDAGGAGKNSRLDRGIEIARDLVSSLGDSVRIGAAMGKGRGVVAVPLTYDSEAVLNFLDSLDGFSVTGTGTNLESLIDAASGAFRDESPSRREIILFSDGEALSGAAEAALNRARDQGAALSAVGLGSGEGGPVPVEPGPLAPDGVLLSDGVPVISVRRGNFLERAAEKSGGLYVDGNRDDAAREAAGYIRSLSADSALTGRRREARPRWRLFVLLALASLGFSRLLSFSLRKGARALLPVLACVFPLLGSSCSGVQGKLYLMEGNFYNSRGMYTEAAASYLKALDYPDAAPYGEYGLGAAYFALEEGKAALERYRQAEKALENLKKDTHRELRYRIHYNSGIILFEEGDYDEAARAFKDALKIDGGRVEAKRNLELSLLFSLSQDSSRTGSANSGAGEEGGGEAGTSALFEYLRKKEQDQWKSREWQADSGPAGPDY
jgi:Ca-activated chloride channel family protein